MKQNYILIAIGVLFVLVTIIVFTFFGENDSIFGNYGKLYINEVSATNFSTITDEDGDYVDYIEIYNGYGFDVNLNGYGLSDKEYNTNKWIFPDVTIKSGEYLVVFASGKDRYDEYIHTNFKLKEEGEIITLTDNENTVISKIKLEHTGYDTSYGYTGVKYVYYYEPTPGVKNGGKTSIKPINFNDDFTTLRITEYITENTMLYDSDGDYNSMVEIYNYGDEDINLKGYFISDNMNKLSKYVLPEVIVKSNNYVIIYLSGKNKYENNEIHANFKIKEGEVVVVSSLHGKKLDSVNIIRLPNNTSYGLKDNDWCYYPTPTFGLSNTTKCFEKLGG